jgi:hypothetical protein
LGGLHKPQPNIFRRVRHPELIADLTTFLTMHVCHLGEVCYDFFRSDGLPAAATAWSNILALPLTRRRDMKDKAASVGQNPGDP